MRVMKLTENYETSDPVENDGKIKLKIALVVYVLLCMRVRKVFSIRILFFAALIPFCLYSSFKCVRVCLIL